MSRRTALLGAFALVVAFGCGPGDDAAPGPGPASGPLDASFGTGGQVTTSFSGGNAVCYAMALQSDGRIVAAGLASNGIDLDFAVVRYTADGSLDPAFGTGGKVVTPIGPANDLGYSVAIQADGKIVVAGTTDNGTDKDFAVVRYNDDGSLDATFDGDGIVTTAVGAIDDVAWSVAIQTDDKIVVAGYADGAADDDFAVVRYNPDGSLDSSFGTGGKVITSVGFDDLTYSAAIQPDGRIVVAGLSEGAVDEDFAVVRYNADGSLDATFGAGGIVTTPIGSGDDYGWSVTLQADGKIVVAGYAEEIGSDDYAIVRYNPDGSLDASFGTGGIVVTSVAGSGLAYSVALTPDGQIVLGGALFDGTSVVVATLRYAANGALDTSFGSGGMATAWFTSNSLNYGYAVRAQPDGRTLLAGYSIDLGRAVFALARYR